MKYNVIEKFLKYEKDKLNELFEIFLREDYMKKYVDPFIETYLNVRYIDDISDDIDENEEFIVKVNKELQSKYLEIKNDKYNELLKNIVSLFTYVIYLDEYRDTSESDIDNIINVFMEDKNIKIEKDPKMPAAIKRWHKKHISNKDLFFETLDKGDITVNLTPINDNEKLIYTQLNPQFNISKLYSSYAINFVYSEDRIKEDLLMVSLVKISEKIIIDAINQKYDNNYIVDIPNSLFDKDKKMTTTFNIIENNLSKKCIQLKIDYGIFDSIRVKILEMVQQGFQFSTNLKDRNINAKDMVLFETIFVNEDNENYKNIVKLAKSYKVNLITNK